jgi:predicted ribosome quality control (RQC) complex YloA/Tae2 family protein
VREVTSSEIRVLVNEMSHLNSSFLKKFYDLGEDSFRFGFYKDGKNTQVYCRLLSTINETRFAEQAEQATQFAIGVRKRIEDQKVLRIYQHNFDRIIILEILARGEAYKLVIEMFGKGNVILLNKDGKIVQCQKTVLFRGREIRPHAVYIFPESNSVDPEKADRETIKEILEDAQSKGGRLISELSKSINVGPLYLEDMISRCGLDPRGKLETEAQLKELADAILDFAAALKDPKPIAYLKDGAIVDYAIRPIRKYEGLEKIEYKRLNELLDEIHSEGRFSKKDVVREKRIEEIDANIAKQQELAARLKIDSENYRAMANKIFEKMGAINSVITYMRENKHATLEQVRGVFKDIKIKEIDLKNKVVKIEVD